MRFMRTAGVEDVSLAPSAFTLPASVVTGSGISVVDDFWDDGTNTELPGYVANELKQTSGSGTAGPMLSTIVHVTDYKNAEYTPQMGVFNDSNANATLAQIGNLSIWEVPGTFTKKYLKRKAEKEKKDVKELDTLLPALRKLLQKADVKEKPPVVIQDYFSRYVEAMKSFNLDECKKEADIPRPYETDQMGRLLYEGLCVTFKQRKLNGQASGSAAAGGSTPVGLNALKK